MRYDGEEGYESNSEEIKLTKEQQTITLNPPYSEPKLASILKTESYYIGQVLHSAYPKIDEYEIQPGQLYNKGEWFGTTLIYKGEDYFNTDTLRVILHKENGQWIIKTRPPNIILSKVDFPDIPINILRKVNSQ